MNLYRLSPKRGSKTTIGTWFEMVSCGSRFSERLTRAAAVRDSQSHQKQWIKMDVDGSHIRVLFLTFIWKFCPELLDKGYVYAAVPPLYKITMGTKIQYLKDDPALETFRKTNTKKFELGRMKGYEVVWPLSTFPLISGVYAAGPVIRSVNRVSA